ncbi:MAG TPA: hypothetical protein VE755_10545 [Myxococcales bacterium]|jgi:hypothetical protein|nr:hypothetical protein [Myxococcales bacterium]
MRNLKTISLILLPLLGCFAQVENPDIALSHNLCGGTTACMPGNMPLGLIQISGQNTFTVDFGDQPLLQPSTSVGPATVNTSLILSGAAVQLQDPSSGDFGAVQTISLLAAPSGTDCQANPASCTTLADYDRTRDGAATQTLVLRGRNVDLITLISTAHTLDLQLQGSGTGPGNAWNADVSMDMALKARANFP